MSAWTLLERYIERDRGLADLPWRPQGQNAWGKRRGRMSALVSMSPRGDGSWVVSSVLSMDGVPKRRQVPVGDHASALAKAEAMKLEIDSRSI